MTNEILTEIVCPNCLNPIDVRKHGQHVICDACRSQFILQGHICPECNTYHREEQSFCGECGQAMTRICQKCQTVNWAGDEYCKTCGSAMDILEMLRVHHKATTEDRLQDQMTFAQEIKRRERQDSNKRMAKMVAQEQARLQELGRRRRERKKKDKQMFVIVGIITAVVIILLLLFTVMFS